MSKTKIRMSAAVFMVLIVTSAFAVLAIGIVSGGGPTYVSGSLTSNTTWYASEAPYIVTGDVVLFPGYTLTIEPGVTVKFYNNTKLVIRGTLNASGTELQRIVFTSANTSTKGVWDGVRIATNLGGKATIKYANFYYAGTATSVECCWSGGPVEIYDTVFINNSVALGGYAGWDMIVERCTFENNTYAVTDADKKISYSVFKNNDYGIYNGGRNKIYSSVFEGNHVGLHTGDDEVRFCIFQDNDIGIDNWWGAINISYSNVTNNEVGIILNGHPSRVEHNNIFSNIVYNLKNGDPKDRQVPNNWWGTTDTDAINMSIYDGYDDPSVGIVYYQPILTEPVTPENIPPIASFTYDPLNPIVDQTVMFDASASYDIDGSIVSYDWEFGDEGSATGEIVTHSYSASGDYIVNLTVTDDDGATGSTSKKITVVPPPPPTISITTDEFEYSPGDIMTITMDIANPTEDSVMFQWFWVVPQFSVCVPVMSAPIPAGYADTHDFSFTIPNWGSTPFGNVFYVQLLDASGEVLDADAECWAYSPGGEAMPAAKVNIAKEIKKTVERIE